MIDRSVTLPAAHVQFLTRDNSLVEPPGAPCQRVREYSYTQLIIAIHKSKSKAGSKTG